MKRAYISFLKRIRKFRKALKEEIDLKRGKINGAYLKTISKKIGKEF